MSVKRSIAIDGPAGAGKSTIAKEVARSLGFTYVDTGALYRAIALYMIENSVDYSSEEEVGNILNSVLINLEYIDGIQHVFLGKEDVSSKIRKEEVGNCASKISAYPSVRQKLLDTQRNLADTKDVIMDGRDIGSVVLPDAGLKIFLTASVDTRVKRRFNELVSKGETPNIEKIKQDIINRDHQDRTRRIAPLIQAADAVLVDTSEMTIAEVVSKIISLYEG